MSNGASPTDGTSQSVKQDSIWNDPVGVLIVGGVTAVALAIGLYFAGFFSTGDEPPIRVRNGSLDLYVASSNQKWKPKTSPSDPRNWRISGGKRADKTLDLIVAANPGANCSARSGSGNTLTITYDDGTGNAVVVTLQDDANDNYHTLVTSNTDLAVDTTKDNKGRILSYAKAGFISGITLTGASPVSCTFKTKEELAELLIMDY